jgi:NADH-quinone oxidoreductase subunit N
MPGNIMPPAADYLRIAPEILLALAGTLVMVISAVRGRRTGLLTSITLAGVLAAMAGAVFANLDPGPAFSGLVDVNLFSTFFRLVILAAGLMTVLTSCNYLKRESTESGEFYALLLFSLIGQSLMCTASDLIMMFIGLEISSISSYILAGFLRDDRRNNEAALKYFLLGSFATAFLLYGVAWIYGLTGTTRLIGIQHALEEPQAAPPVLLVGVAAALIFVGIAFKVAAVPFQSWAPDVYQGAPAPVSGFLSAGPKAAAFGLFLRVFMTSLQPVADHWQPIVWTSALLTMIAGNFAALQQTNIKRLLAYSSIAHAGYVMVAVASVSRVGVAAAMFYLAAYIFMQVGSFAIVTHVAGKGERHVNVDDFAGLGERQPITAGMFSIFLLSLIGIPLTGGFFGKFYIFKAALDSGLVWLTVLGLLNSAVAAYYYLRILVVMYMREPGDGAVELAPLAPTMKVAVYGAAAMTLLLGIFPTVVLAFANQSVNLPR